MLNKTRAAEKGREKGVAIVRKVYAKWERRVSNFNYAKLAIPWAHMRETWLALSENLRG